MTTIKTGIRAGLAGMLMLLMGGLTASSNQVTLVDEIAAQLVPEKVSAALLKVPDESRKLLALRSYLRSAGILEERWSWTKQEIGRFDGSPAQVALQAEIDAVSAHFAKANPGYEIYVHSKVRSLEVQLDHWNENDSVGASAEELGTAWRESGTASIDPADTDARKRFETWLKRFKPTNRAHIAAPGLSRHGRAQAVDFQVKKGGVIVAATDYKTIESVWKEGGWEMKLNASVTAASPSFSGPLASPHEPWHYDYVPSPD